MNRKQRRAQAKARPPNADPAQALYAQAVARYQAQDLAGTVSLCRQALALEPDHAEALHLLGLMALQAGRAEEAAALIGRSLAQNPACAEAHNHLGHALNFLGRLEASAGAYARALALGMDSAVLHHNLGVTLRDLGRADEALAAFQRAIARKPDYAEAHNGLGVALHRLGRSEDAASAYRTALAANPDLAEAHNNLGVSLRRLRRPREACGACERAIALRPGYAEAHNNLANALHDLGRDEEAIALYRKALALKPDYAEACNNLAIALQEVGRAAEALAATGQALSLEANSAHAWHIRADLKRFAAGDQDIARMEGALAAAEASANAWAQTQLRFALGKAWMDAGQPDQAFAHLEAGNRLKRASFAYDVEADARRLGAIGEAFTPEAMRRLDGPGHPSETPVFVVGMPRSGTSLVEQILASHPDVCGAGELSLLGDLIEAALASAGAALDDPAGLARLGPDDLAGLGRRYVETIGSLWPGCRRVIDKTPSNFQFVGLIRLMLPGARVIWCRRGAADACFSCYARLFAGRQDFAYDLRELGLYHRGQEALCEHWRALSPADRFAEVRYEAVVADLEGEARRLIAFCGLEWDDACLAFHETRRPVRTASVNQVRQPLFRDGVGRWRPYARHLAPLLEALQAP